MAEVERFPFTLPLAISFIYCFLTLGYLQINAIASGLVQLEEEIWYLLFLLIGGPILLLVTSLAFTGSTVMLRPKRLLARWDPKQALAVIAGLGLTAVWQLYVNQLTIGPYKSQLSQQALFAFSTDAAIAEESGFGALSVALYVFFRLRFHLGRFTAIAVATPIVAYLFAQWHNTDIAYASIPVALIFVFGLRTIITPISLYTHSIFSGIAIHWPWNAIASGVAG